MSSNIQKNLVSSFSKFITWLFEVLEFSDILELNHILNNILIEKNIRGN